MLQAMDKMKADTSTIVTMDNGSVTSISEAIDVGGVKYALVKYSFEMTMTFVASENESEDDEDDANDADAGEVAYEMLKEKYGEKNVTYDSENRKVEVNVTNELYAIHDPAYKDWKFLEKKENMKPLLEKLLPKQVLKKL
jgi:hypothetical protein